jgi:hypothetical protein
MARGEEYIPIHAMILEAGEQGMEVKPYVDAMSERTMLCYARQFEGDMNMFDETINMYAGALRILRAESRRLKAKEAKEAKLIK